MNKLFAAIVFVMLPHISFAGEWVLWHCEFMSETQTNPPIPLTEHQTLKACQVAAVQNPDHISSWAKNSEDVETKSVLRFINPDGIFYKYKTGNTVKSEYRCYPYGVVPTHVHFQPKATE